MASDGFGWLLPPSAFPSDFSPIACRYLPREDYQQGLAAINGCAAASPSDPATPCRASNAADAARDGLPPVSPPVASLSGRSALDIRRQVEATREPLPPIAPIPRPESGGGRSMLD